MTAADLAGINGTTVVTFRIVEGAVRDATVRQSSGKTALDRAAVECISSRRYVRQFVTVDGKDVDKFSSIAIRERIDWNDALKPGH